MIVEMIFSLFVKDPMNSPYFNAEFVFIWNFEEEVKKNFPFCFNVSKYAYLATGLSVYLNFIRNY